MNLVASGVRAVFVSGFVAMTGVVFATFPTGEMVVCISGFSAGTGI